MATLKQIGTVILMLGPWSTVFAMDFTVADLDPRGWVEIRFQSQGCEHHTKARITIRKTDTYLAEVSTGLESDPMIIELSANDVTQLDRLIAYYRQLSGPGACTTEDTVTLVWQGTHIKTFIEPFVDATCDAPPEGHALLRKLMQAVHESKRRPSNNQLNPWATPLACARVAPTG